VIIFNTKPTWIEKAKRPKWKSTKTFKRTEALTKTMSNAVRLDFHRGIMKFKKRINPESIYQAWLSKDYSKLYAVVPWQQLPDDMDQYAKSIGRVIKTSSDFAIDTLPPPISKDLRFDMKNPKLRSYVDNSVGGLVVDITKDTQDLIARTISRSFDNALTPRKVAELIKPSIGLYPGQVTALQNYRAGLEKQGVAPRRLEAQVSAYEDRLLDARALMIGRTETRDAFNQGQLSVWNTAADQGLIDRQTTMKQWITDGNPCPLCIDLEEQGPIPFDENWESEEEDVDAPPLHPNCYCDIELVFSTKEE
jgi:hypothetical protein